jgi:hypothetical protein
MKINISAKILFLFISLFCNSVAYCQLSGYNRVTYGNYMLGENVPKVLSVEVVGKIGQFPNWEGLNNLINDVNKAVEVKLRSKQPYKIVPYQNVLKTNYTVKDTNYTKIQNVGNTLILGITLQECNERERDWYFDFYASIYPGNYENISKEEIFKNLEERFRYIARDSKINRIGNDIRILEYLNSPSTEDYKFATNIVSGLKYKNEEIYQASLTKLESGEKSLENSKLNNESKSLNISKNVIEQNQINLKNKSSYSPGTFLLTERCTDCRGKKFEIKEKSDICYNCRHWNKSRKDYDYCQVCKNLRAINITSYRETCIWCKGKGVRSRKVSNSFKSLVYNYLDDLSKFDNKIGPNTLGIYGKLFMVYRGFEDRLQFNVGYDLWYSDQLTIFADGHSIYKTGSNDQEFIGSWSINNDKLYIEIPNINLKNGETKTIQIIKSKKK